MNIKQKKDIANLEKEYLEKEKNFEDILSMTNSISYDYIEFRELSNLKYSSENEIIKKFDKYRALQERYTTKETLKEIIKRHSGTQRIPYSHIKKNETKETSTFKWDKHNAFLSCCKTPISPYIGLYKSTENNFVKKTGIATCKNIWSCPTCSPKISYGRSQEIEKATAQHIESNGDIAMLTFTLAHTKNDSLKYLKTKLSKCINSFLKHRTINEQSKKINLRGQISALEVTMSLKNGYHPHKHTLVFIKKSSPEEKKEFEDICKKMWVKICKQNKIKSSYENGLDILFTNKNNSSSEILAKYISKMSYEMTLSHTKKNHYGNKKSFTFFQLLQNLDIEKICNKEYEEMEKIKMIINYIKDIKGSRQLRWSPGLKKRFNIEQKTDEEIYTDIEKKSEYACSIPANEIKKIVVKDSFFGEKTHWGEIDNNLINSKIEDFKKYIKKRFDIEIINQDPEKIDLKLNKQKNNLNQKENKIIEYRKLLRKYHFESIDENKLMNELKDKKKKFLTSKVKSKDQEKKEVFQPYFNYENKTKKTI